MNTRDTPADNVRGAILLVMGFAALIPLVEASVKTLGHDGMSALQITWSRFMFQIAVAGPLLFATEGRAWWRSLPLKVFILRGLFITSGSAFLYAGLAFIPMADSVAIYFISPLLLTALSALVLQEHVGPWRWGAVAVGFIGALLIAGPNFRSVGWAAALPALAALGYASSAILTRRYRIYGSALAFQFTTAVTGCALLTALLAAGAASSIPAIAPVWPSANELGLLALIGLIGTLTNFMLTQAYRLSPSSIIAPFLYLEIVGATCAGFLVFGDVPGLETVAGTVIVVGAGLIVWWREASAAKRLRMQIR